MTIPTAEIQGCILPCGWKRQTLCSAFVCLTSQPPSQGFWRHLQNKQLALEYCFWGNLLKIPSFERISGVRMRTKLVFLGNPLREREKN